MLRGSLRKLTWIALSLLVGLAASLADLLAVALLGLAAIVLIVVCVSRRGTHALLHGLMAAAAFTAPLNGLRVGGLLTVADVLLIGGAILILAIRSVRPVDSTWRFFQPFLISVGLIGFGGLVGTLIGGYGWNGIVDLVRFVLSTLGVLAVFGLWAPERASVRLLAWAFLAGTAVNGFLGIFLLKDTVGRAIGLAVHSNHFAVAGLLACGAGIGLSLTSEGRRRSIASGLTAVVAAGLIASGSRAAIVGLLAFVVWFLLYARQLRLIAWSLCVGTAMVLAVGSGVVSPTSTDALGRLIGKDPTAALSDDARRDARSTAVRSIEANPITGVGFSAAKEAHNVYLQLWAASGLFGVAGALGLMFAAGRMVWARPKKDMLLGALVCSYGGYLVAAMFSTVLWDRYLWLHVALAVALCSSRRAPSSDPEGAVGRDPGSGRDVVASAHR